MEPFTLTAQNRFPNRRFQFHKRSQLFIRAHNETLSVIAVRIGNEDRSPVEVHSRNTAPTPTGFAEIVGDDFPVLHAGLLRVRLQDRALLNLAKPTTRTFTTITIENGNSILHH